MKATGIVRRVDDLGRIVIPKEIRRQLGVSENTPMELFLEDKSLIIRKYETNNCIKDRLDEFKSVFYDSREDLDSETANAIEVHINALLGIMKSIKESEE